ncbi:26S proteasome non-ATPase regulatory subunit 11 [Cichlidogyrus casuarinus]|uniref:26S proteasome non-ATPase regulatory subunit 11 n=1 Tax=Cichlidogyrus casuarinus TaxID=1844966 RepID=A0ABD2Q2N0_9PLAT
MDIFDKQIDTEDELGMKQKEQAFLTLGEKLFNQKDAKGLGDLIVKVRPFLKQVSRSKAARIVRNLVDQFLDLEGGSGREITLCQDCIDWAKAENRSYLRQALEARLMGLYFDNKKYNEALKLGSGLLTELKKLDDKILLVEVQLMESQVYYRLNNLQRAKAALTSARTTANSIYCPPKLQASLDLCSGILHCADEREFKTAYSYFYEAFEGFDSVNSSKALISLQYMLLCKIMMNCADEINNVLTSKLGMRYKGSGIDALKEIGKAAHNRSLGEFKTVREKYSVVLDQDPVLTKHLSSFYHTLLGRNLVKLIEPYSRVHIKHIADKINLPLSTVEKKLSQMILDKEINGILDQGDGVLIIAEDPDQGERYDHALDTISSLGHVVDLLFQKSKKLT